MPSNSPLLKTLIEPALPEAITWMPQTLGWKIFFAVLLLTLIYIAYKKVQQWRANRYRRDALKALKEVQSLSPQSAINKTNYTLKQTAANAFGHEPVAALSGADWLEFLIAHSTSDIDRICFLQCQEALHKPIDSMSIDDALLARFIEQSRQWIMHHERQNQGEKDA